MSNFADELPESVTKQIKEESKGQKAKISSKSIKSIRSHETDRNESKICKSCQQQKKVINQLSIRSLKVV